MLLWRDNIEEIKYQTEETICAQFEVKVSFVCLGDNEKASVTEIMRLRMSLLHYTDKNVDRTQGK